MHLSSVGLCFALVSFDIAHRPLFRYAPLIVFYLLCDPASYASRASRYWGPQEIWQREMLTGITPMTFDRALGLYELPATDL